MSKTHPTPMMFIGREGHEGYRWTEGCKAIKIRRPEDATPILRDLIGPLMTDREAFVLVLLDARHAVANAGVISVGTLNASLVHPREVFRAAVADGAAAIIVAHNHPSGNPKPSGDDLDLTKRLDKCGDLLGIALLDHLILTETEQTSLREYGWPK